MEKVAKILTQNINQTQADMRFIDGIAQQIRQIQIKYEPGLRLDQDGRIDIMEFSTEPANYGGSMDNLVPFDHNQKAPF
jgi:hypothetical protein